MNSIKRLCIILFAAILSVNCYASDLPKLKEKFQDITVVTKKGKLIIENSKVERVWRLTEYGLVTESVENRESGKIWSNPESTQLSDWAYKGLVDETTKGELISVTATVGDDEGFTSKVMEVIAEFSYPKTKSSIKYKIWIYPNAPGFRTQTYIKSGDENVDVKKAKGSTEFPWVELRTGKNINPYSAGEATDGWFASTSFHKESVELRAFNLNPEKKYKIGLSWWDFKNGGGKQQVRITSVDGESNHIVIPATTVPDYKGKKEQATEMFGDVPDGINVDGTIRIYIDNVDGIDATISEIWVMEEGADKDGDISYIMGEESRIKNIASRAVDGYGLVAYYDCGVNINLDKFVTSGHSDFLPVSPEDIGRRYMGYYNDTQHRNSWNTPIYKETYLESGKAVTENVNWANIISVENGNDGVMMLKESHKCVNQYGVDTGEFLWSKSGVTNTGTSLLRSEITPDSYKWFWGSWLVVYEGDENERQLALKQFDRYRFPIDLERDMYTVMCTWGHSKNQRDGRNYAVEAEVLKEMDFVVESGIDMLLIDDGWQSSLENKGARPDGGLGWQPHPSTYPEGWKNVIKKAEDLDLTLGLWGIAQNMKTDEMIWNWNYIKMKQLKLDFASFGTNTKLDKMMQTVRDYMIAIDHKGNISWDLTENAARYGYYWAREYGNVHFMNRKPFMPMNVLYIPSLSLRDFWMLSKYNNLNKYQLVIQNPEVVDQMSDACKHSPEYCVATALMGIPEFMAVTRFYSEESRANIKALLAVYKEHRENIFTSYVFPVGDQPTNSSWTGFQAYHQDRDFGYLTIFRELENREVSKEIKLRFVGGKTIKITDLESDISRTVEVPADGSVKFESAETAAYQFLKYEIVK